MTNEELQAALLALVKESGVSGGRASTYNWAEVDAKIRAEGKPVTAGQVQKLAKTKHFNEARGWLERMVEVGKYMAYPPKEEGVKRRGVCYVPTAIVEAFAAKNKAQ